MRAFAAVLLLAAVALAGCTDGDESQDPADLPPPVDRDHHSEDPAPWSGWWHHAGATCMMVNWQAWIANGHGDDNDRPEAGAPFQRDERMTQRMVDFFASFHHPVDDAVAYFDGTEPGDYGSPSGWHFWVKAPDRWAGAPGTPLRQVAGVPPDLEAPGPGPGAPPGDCSFWLKEGEFCRDEPWDLWASQSGDEPSAAERPGANDTFVRDPVQEDLVQAYYEDRGAPVAEAFVYRSHRPGEECGHPSGWQFWVRTGDSWNGTDDGFEDQGLGRPHSGAVR